MTVESFIDVSALSQALKLEEYLLSRRINNMNRLLPSLQDRLDTLYNRI